MCVHTYVWFRMRMCVCACVRMPAHVHVCATMSVRTHVFVCGHTHGCLHNTHVCTRLHTFACKHVFVCETTCIWMAVQQLQQRMLTVTYLCVRMHAYAAAHRYVHTCVCTSPKRMCIHVCAHMPIWACTRLRTDLSFCKVVQRHSIWQHCVNTTFFTSRNACCMCVHRFGHTCVRKFLYAPSHTFVLSDVCVRNQMQVYHIATITMYISICKCMCAYAHVWFCMHVRVCACIHKHARVRARIIYTGTCIHVLCCVRTHMYVCTTHMYVCGCAPLGGHRFLYAKRRVSRCDGSATVATVTICMCMHQRMLAVTYLCVRMHACADAHRYMHSCVCTWPKYVHTHVLPDAGLGMHTLAHSC